MSELFKGQTLFSLNAETGYASLGSADVTQIAYQKPSGTTGTWDANVSGTVLIYNVSLGDIDVVGTWQFQAYIEISSMPTYGQIYKHHFKKPLI
jgi:hypothetical protein